MTPADAARLRSNPRERFDHFAARWRAESQAMSNTTQMAMLQSYQCIIGMGDAAVPLLLEALKRNPEHWFWALEAITDVDPVPPEDRGHVGRMAEAWLKWGVAHGYIEP